MLREKRTTVARISLPLFVVIALTALGPNAWGQPPAAIKVVNGQKAMFPLGWDTLQNAGSPEISDPSVCDLNVKSVGSSQFLVVTGKRLGVATVLLQGGTAANPTQVVLCRIAVTLDKQRVNEVLTLMKLKDVKPTFAPDDDKVVLEGFTTDEGAVRTAIQLLTGPRFPESAIINRVSLYWPYEAVPCYSHRSCWWGRR